MYRFLTRSKNLNVPNEWSRRYQFSFSFALKKLKTREFWKNTNVFGFKTAENCQDAQNLPSVTVSKAPIGQIFSQNGVFTLAEKSGQWEPYKV